MVQSKWWCFSQRMVSRSPVFLADFWEIPSCIATETSWLRQNYTYWGWYLLVFSTSVNLKSPLLISVWILRELTLAFTKSPSSKGQTAYMAFTTRGSMWVQIASQIPPISAALLHFVTQNVVVRRAASHGFFFPRSSIKFWDIGHESDIPVLYVIHELGPCEMTSFMRTRLALFYVTPLSDLPLNDRHIGFGFVH